MLALMAHVGPEPLHFFPGLAAGSSQSTQLVQAEVFVEGSQALPAAPFHIPCDRGIFFSQTSQHGKGQLQASLEPGHESQLC